MSTLARSRANTHLVIAWLLVAFVATSPSPAAAQDLELHPRDPAVAGVFDLLPLRLAAPTVPPGSRDSESIGLLVTGGVFLALSLPAFGAVLSQVSTFDERTPEWAMAALGGSAILGPTGVLALGAGLADAAGGDPHSGLLAGSIADLVIGMILGAVAIAIAPGVGAPWASPDEQARVAELLGIQAFAFGFTGSLALSMGLASPP